MKYLTVLLLTVCSFFTHLSKAQLRVPKLISDGMILQRDTEVSIWGWASPDCSVTITFTNRTFSTTTNSKGKWEVALPATKAGGPYKLMIVSEKETIAIRDVLFGDVWVCSGQSNMELPIRRVQWNYEEEIAAINNPQIRQFYVPREYDFNEQRSDVSNGIWKPATPENILDFSAVAYFFAEALYNEYRIPIAIINSALGGSPAQAWMSEEALHEFPHYVQEANKYKDTLFIRKTINNDSERIGAWHKEMNANDVAYKSNTTYKSGLAISTNWDSTTIPGYFSNTPLEGTNGSVWFQKSVTVPESFVASEALLLLGRVIDADSVFINGTFVGTTGYQYPPRRYSIPAGILHEGQNTITVRLISNSGDAGFKFGKSYTLTNFTDSVDLTGYWKYKVGAAMPPLAGQTFIRWKPTGLYNAMLAPLFNYKTKGILWYQGEANTQKPHEYEALMKAMITDWRTAFQQPDLPFIYAQLPNYMQEHTEPTESNWSQLREAQRKITQIPHTGMAVTIGLGEEHDIHTLNKKAVGERLALQARKIAYGDSAVIANGPTLKRVDKKDHKLIVSFENTANGLQTKDGKAPALFAIAGLDKKFVWASTRLDENTVVVWNDQVREPKYIRYAWDDNPKKANLMNSAGLVAGPFECCLKKLYFPDN